MLQPIYQRSYTSPSNTTLTKSMSISLSGGDFLVYYFFGSDIGMTPSGGNPPFVTNASGANNWVLRASQGPATGYGNIYCWTATVPGTTTNTWTIQQTAAYSGTGGSAWMFHMQVFRGVAAYRDFWQNRGSGAPLVNATQREHNSVYSWALVDWNVRDATTRTYRVPAGATWQETMYQRDTQQTNFAGFYSNLGEPNDVNALGLTVPSTIKWSQLAIELNGRVDPRSYVVNADRSLTSVTPVGISDGNGGTTPLFAVELT